MVMSQLFSVQKEEEALFVKQPIDRWKFLKLAGLGDVDAEVEKHEYDIIEMPVERG